MWHVEIVADSINPADNRLTTFVLTYPRFIHSELMTHRVFSRNAASSRAIPIQAMLVAVQTDTAKPIRWGINGKGMQDHGEASVANQYHASVIWESAMQDAVNSALRLNKLGIHKQIVNRLLEPFMWMTTIVTATEWTNFFKLRVHPAAQPEFQHLAHLMLQHYLFTDVNSRAIVRTADNVPWGHWHIPFDPQFADDPAISLDERLAVSVARCARVSYTKHDLKYSAMEDEALVKRLGDMGHWSPFEHQARADKYYTDSNFEGWSQYRKIKEPVKKQVDLLEHLQWYESQLKSDIFSDSQVPAEENSERS